MVPERFGGGGGGGRGGEGGGSEEVMPAIKPELTMQL